MTLRQYLANLNTLPDSVLDLPVYRYSTDGYVPVEKRGLVVEQVATLGCVDGAQFITTDGDTEAWPTLHEEAMGEVDVAFLENKITVFTI